MFFNLFIIGLLLIVLVGTADEQADSVWGRVPHRRVFPAKTLYRYKRNSVFL